MNRIVDVSSFFKMKEFYPDFENEKCHFAEQVNEITHLVKQSLLNDYFYNFENLSERVHELKSCINKSKMYSDFWIYIQTREFNELVLSPNQEYIDNNQNNTYAYYMEIMENYKDEMQKKSDEEIDKAK